MQIKKAAAILCLLSSTPVLATQLNIRHEYIATEGSAKATHRDRIALSHGFDNGFAIGLEAKYGPGANEKDALSNQKSFGHEFGLFYNHKVTDSFKIIPFYQADANSTGITHKFNLEANKKINDVWWMALRYRYAYKNKSEPGEADFHYNQYNLVSGYTIGDYRLGVDFEFVTRQEAMRHENFNRDKTALSVGNFTAEYRGLESGWMPFIELGMVSANTNGSNDDGADKYIPRYRFGIKYDF